MTQSGTAVCPVCGDFYVRTISPLAGCSPECKSAYSRIPRRSRLDPARKSGRQIRPESLTMKHLGREFPGLGLLVEFRCTSEGWLLVGTDATGFFPPDASIPYSGGHHHVPSAGSE